MSSSVYCIDCERWRPCSCPRCTDCGEFLTPGDDRCMPCLLGDAEEALQVRLERPPPVAPFDRETWLHDAAETLRGRHSNGDAFADIEQVWEDFNATVEPRWAVPREALEAACAG